MLIDLFKLFISIKYINISSTKIHRSLLVSTLTKYTYMFLLLSKQKGLGHSVCSSLKVKFQRREFSSQVSSSSQGCIFTTLARPLSDVQICLQSVFWLKVLVNSRQSFLYKCSSFTIKLHISRLLFLSAFIFKLSLFAPQQAFSQVMSNILLTTLSHLKS